MVHIDKNCAILIEQFESPIFIFISLNKKKKNGTLLFEICKKFVKWHK